MDVMCLDFLNSEWHDFRGRWVEDRLQKPEWRHEFLKRWDILVPDVPDTETLEELVKLRALIRHIVESLPQAISLDEELHALNQIMRDAPPIPHLYWSEQKYEMKYVPLKKNWEWVMAKIATSFADLLVSTDTRRLKVCENPDCHWVYYDESKSRTRRYCSNDKCGNLLKLRRFRSRQKAAQGKD
ncbi:MAG: CGNR zinc finger domain-containing protein [Chloroflexi bacterium]|nr:CGNR zinc finger domain-containing protein [Chloroflexota bacterium]